MVVFLFNHLNAAISSHKTYQLYLLFLCHGSNEEYFMHVPKTRCHNNNRNVVRNSGHKIRSLLFWLNFPLKEIPHMSMTQVVLWINCMTRLHHMMRVQTVIWEERMLSTKRGEGHKTEAQLQNLVFFLTRYTYFYDSPHNFIFFKVNVFNYTTCAKHIIPALCQVCVHKQSN